VIERNAGHREHQQKQRSDNSQPAMRAP